MTMQTQEFKQAVMNKLEECRWNLDREFFDKYIAGRLTKEALRDYYNVVYHECQYFVRLVSLLHSKAARRDVRMLLAANLMEEYCNGDLDKSHPSLMLCFAGEIGNDPKEIEAAKPPPMYGPYWNTLWDLADSSIWEGLAGLCFHEYECPKRFVGMKKALIQYYGVGADKLRYFDEHISDGSSSIKDDSLPGYGGDDIHVARQVDCIAQYATTKEEQAAVLKAIERAGEARSTLNQEMNTLYGHTNAA